jgi:antitoxin component of RelBE/YafQ-DinJ toxin-antitoxin module
MKEKVIRTRIEETLKNEFEKSCEYNNTTYSKRIRFLIQKDIQKTNKKLKTHENKT